MVGLMLWVESGLKGCCGGLSNRSIVEGYRGGFAVVAVDFRCVCVCTLLGGLIGNGGLGCGFTVCVFFA